MVMAVVVVMVVEGVAVCHWMIVVMAGNVGCNVPSSKVSHLNTQARIHKAVLRLQVTVHCALVV
jgi:hypothetical protein